MKQSPTHKIGIIGVGSIGSVLARGFAGLGHRVVVNDVFPEAEGLPYHSTTKTDIGATCDFAVIAVPTPTTEFGGDASAVDAVLAEFTPAHDAQVIIRSTMPPGATQRLADKHQRDLVFMPEFLRDRSDVDDFYTVDRMVLSGPPDACRRVRTLCEHPDRDIGQVIECDYLTAELGKLAHNAFFATKVSFANQMRSIAEAEGADPETVMDIVTADSRNTDSHLDPMLGPYGGSCLPKDIAMLRYYAHTEQDVPTPVLDGTIGMNEMAKESYEYRDIEGVWPNVKVAE